MPIGFLEYEDEDRYKFIRGGKVLPVPTERALLLDDNDWDLIYSNDQNYNFEIGSLSSNKNQKFKINGNNFFLNIAQLLVQQVLVNHVQLQVCYKALYKLKIIII
jgi:hypothetical protein